MTDRRRSPLPSFLASTLFAIAVALAIGAAPDARARKRKQLIAPVEDSAPDALTYGQRDDVRRFAEDLSARESELDASWVAAALAQARYKPSVARLMMPPPAGTAKNWAAYRARFVEPQRLRAGLEFWQRNERWLDMAEQRWGVPAEVVVGIVGVETLYGRDTGGFRVIDALATLSFDFPVGRRDRSAFFRDELAQYLLLCRRAGLEPTMLKGSYAGAMGLPQFMPSSWLKYAVDFDGDGHIDLHGSAADVIGSVANYMAQFGWQRDLPTHYEVAVPVDAQARAALLGPDILPSFTAAQFAEQGAALSAAGRAHDGLLALIELQNGEAAPSYVAGTANFYTITRYNWSSYYAMAVIELGRTVASLRTARR